MAKAREIVVIAGASAGKIVRLEARDVVIGRDDKVYDDPISHGKTVVAIKDHYATGVHCLLIRSSGEWLLHDNRSTNGTYLDRAKIHADTPVPIGVPIHVGATTLVLR